MSDTNANRLEALGPWIIDGTPWWPIREVCDALSVPKIPSARRRAYALVSKENKRYQHIRNRQSHYIEWTVCLIDRAGVERLALRLGGRTPRAELMAALEKSVAGGRTVERDGYGWHGSEK